MCAKCKTKVTAEKRTCVYSLPDHLIVHLKRFEFNFDTLSKVKVNDRFEFPHSFSIQEYTREGLAKRDSESKQQNAANGNDGKTEEKPSQQNSEVKAPAEPSSTPNDSANQSTSSTPGANGVGDDVKKAIAEWEISQRQQPGYYEYTLAGILVHTGMADAGHYYSYIKDASGEWFEFNDTSVRPFDPKDIPANCFGGSVWQEVIDTKTGRPTRRERVFINNAYMLVYDRVYKRKAPPQAILDGNASSLSSYPALPTSIPSPSSSSSSNPLPSEEKISSMNGVSDSSPATSISPIPSHHQNISPVSSSQQQSLPSSSSSNEQSNPASSVLPFPAIVINTPNHVSSSSSSSSSLEQKQSSSSSSSAISSLYDKSKADISNFPPAILQAIWNENMDFLCDKNIFDFNFLCFLWNLTHITHSKQVEVKVMGLQGTDIQQVGKLASVQIVTNYVFKILVRSLDNESFPQWLQFLKDVSQSIVINSLCRSRTIVFMCCVAEIDL